MANTGIGATIVFSNGVSFAANWRSIGAAHVFVDQLDDTSLSSSGYMEAVPDDLKQIDPIDIEFYWDATDNAMSVVGVPCTITITGSLQSGQTTPFTIAGSGFINDLNTPEQAPGTRLMATMQVRFDGKTGPTYTVAG